MLQYITKIVSLFKTKILLTYQHGGIISGHAAVGFTIATSITFLTEDALVTTLSYSIALLVAESRVELKIHSVKEVIIGAILGTFITILVFQIIG